MRQGRPCSCCFCSRLSFLVRPPGILRLVNAVKEGDRQTVRQLLRSHVAVDAGEPDGTTALHWAIRAGDLDTAKLLLAAGARATHRQSLRCDSAGARRHKWRCIPRSKYCSTPAPMRTRRPRMARRC